MPKIKKLFKYLWFILYSFNFKFKYGVFILIKIKDKDNYVPRVITPAAIKSLLL